MTTQLGRPLARGRDGAHAVRPTGIVHIGLGNFFRAHLAWYTEHAPDRDHWGIAAFSGRSTDLVHRLNAQEDLYTLITRHPGGPAVETVSSVSRSLPGPDHASYLALLAQPRTRMVTLTVTEAAYHRGPDGGLDHSHPAVAADLEAWRRSAQAPVTTVPVRLAAGLAARRAAGAGRVTVLSCDNLDRNGAVTARVVHDAATALDPSLAAWIAEHVTFPSSMVDRITPRAERADVDDVLSAAGIADRAPVVTEPFSEWVLEDAFPAGRPAWEAAGARFVADVTAHERRKLLMLNGAHSLLAYVAPPRGHDTVADAMTDPVVRGWVDQWWELARRHVPLDEHTLTAYRAELVDRFANPAIRHRLTQIAADGSQKLPVRVLPVLHAEVAAGRPARAALRPLAAWLLALRGDRRPADPLADTLSTAAAGPLAEAAPRVLEVLETGLARTPGVVAGLLAEAERLGRAAG